MSPMGPVLRESECLSLGHTYITIHGITFPGIAHFIIDELELVLFLSCECFYVKLVIVEYWVVIKNT